MPNAGSNADNLPLSPQRMTVFPIHGLPSQKGFTYGDFVCMKLNTRRHRVSAAQARIHLHPDATRIASGEQNVCARRRRGPLQFNCGGRHLHRDDTVESGGTLRRTGKRWGNSSRRAFRNLSATLRPLVTPTVSFEPYARLSERIENLKVRLSCALGGCFAHSAISTRWRFNACTEQSCGMQPQPTNG